MAYVKNSTWIEGAAPGISAARLNHLETQYDEAVAVSLLRAGTTAISGNQQLNNNIAVQGKTTGGTSRNLIKMSTGNKTIVGSTNVSMRIRSSSQIFLNSTATKIWNASNDGVGSGLDADYVRGYIPMNSTAAYGNATYADVLTGNTTLVKNIALGSTGYRHARVVVMRNTTNTNTQIGLLAFASTNNLRTLVTDGGPGGWSRRQIGTITDNQHGYWTCGNEFIDIKELFLASSASNLRFSFANPEVSTQALNCAIDWEAWR